MAYARQLLVGNVEPAVSSRTALIAETMSAGGKAQADNEPDRSQLRPHRCNDRLEDFIFALFEGEPTKNLPRPWKLMWECFVSKVGEEPTEPFSFLKLDPPKRTGDPQAEESKK